MSRGRSGPHRAWSARRIRRCLFALTDFQAPDTSLPIGVAREPGTQSLLLWHQLFAWGGRGRILRILDEPDVKETQLLLDLDVLAYGLALTRIMSGMAIFLWAATGPWIPTRKPRASPVTRCSGIRLLPLFPGRKTNHRMALRRPQWGRCRIRSRRHALCHVGRWHVRFRHELGWPGSEQTELQSIGRSTSIIPMPVWPMAYPKIIRSWVERAFARKLGLMACAIPGGFISIGRPATSGSATMDRICGSRSISSSRRRELWLERDGRQPRILPPAPGRPGPLR